MKRGAMSANSSSDNHEIVVEFARRRRAIAVQGREDSIQISTLGAQIEARQAQGRRIGGGAGSERLSPESAEAERARRRETGVVGGGGADYRRRRREGERNGGVHCGGGGGGIVA